MEASGAVDLIRLADPCNSFAVRVLGRHMPGVLLGHDFLNAEILVDSEFVTAQLSLCLAQADLDAWQRALDALEAGHSAGWLETGRTAELRIELDEDAGGAVVTVRDVPQSGVSVRVPIELPDGWLAQQRRSLAWVREAYPSEVVETSPNAFAWRRSVL